ARIARSGTLVVKERAFIEAGQAIGGSDVRIMTMHILPSILGEVLVMGSLWAAHAILLEASLSFIGLGVKPPTPTWGGMMKEGLGLIYNAPWIAIFPGVAIVFSVVSLNML